MAANVAVAQDPAGNLKPAKSIAAIFAAFIGCLILYLEP
jgi:hypothetical protein